MDRHFRSRRLSSLCSSLFLCGGRCIAGPPIHNVSEVSLSHTNTSSVMSYASPSLAACFLSSLALLHHVKLSGTRKRATRRKDDDASSNEVLRADSWPFLCVCLEYLQRQQRHPFSIL